MSRPKSKQERKNRRRTRRMLEGSHDYERQGVTPAEAIKLAKEDRATPDVLDGELLTGPEAYIQSDIDRVSKMMQCGVFTKQQKDNMLLLIGSIVANRNEPSNIRIAAYGKIQTEIELYARLSGELDKTDSKATSDYHLHLHGDGTLSPAQQMLADMRALRDAGDEFRGDSQATETDPKPSKSDDIDEN